MKLLKRLVKAINILEEEAIRTSWIKEVERLSQQVESYKLMLMQLKEDIENAGVTYKMMQEDHNTQIKSLDDVLCQKMTEANKMQFGDNHIVYNNQTYYKAVDLQRKAAQLGGNK